MTKPRTTPLRPLADYEFPWLPVYRTELQSLAALLGNELLGAFMRLRAYAWHQDPRCTLPDDDAVLARVSGLGASWGANSTTIRELLKPVADGRLRDMELTAQYVAQAVKSDISQARKYAGRTGGAHSAESRRQQSASNGSSNRSSNEASNGSDLYDPVLNSELQYKQTTTAEDLSPGKRSGSESLVRDSEPGQATGQATGPLGDWREIVDPARARAQRSRELEVGAANPTPSTAPSAAESGEENAHANAGRVGARGVDRD